MLRLGCFSKIGFSRISTTIPATSQFLLNRKFCESQQNSIDSIIGEIKNGISKLESEMERSIVTKKDDKFDPNTLQKSSMPVSRKTAENDDKKPAKLAVHIAKMFSTLPKIKMLRRYTMEYSILDEPNQQRKIEIALKQDSGGTKLIQISQDIEASTDIESCWVIGVQIILPLPKDASLLLNAMDALEDEWKENYAKALRQNRPSMICQQLVKGMIARYKLEIHFHPNKPLDFRMETLAKDDGVLWKLRGPIPIDVFYWLKAQMAELLDEYNDKFKDDEKKDKDDD